VSNHTRGPGCGGGRPGTAQSRNDLCFPPPVATRNSRCRDDAAPPYVCRLTRHHLTAYVTLAVRGSSEQPVVSLFRLSSVEGTVAFCARFSLVYVAFSVCLSRILFVRDIRVQWRKQLRTTLLATETSACRVSTVIFSHYST